MGDKYWQNRRRKEAQQGKPVVISSLKRIEFHIDNVPYIYEYRTDSKSGLSYIFKSGRLIYGPNPSQCTEEGKKVDQLLHESKIIGL